MLRGIFNEKNMGFYPDRGVSVIWFSCCKSTAAMQ